ncbi:MAG TPA: Rab family GTPase [Terriglobales bacterium]|nr:Rab family GTPase [Terriglobales bacterium]
MIQKKICMVGAFGVGKTSLVSRFVHSIFSEKYQTTVGVKIDKKQLTIDGEEVTLVLWDLAGEDALTTVKPAHLRGASGYLLVIDGTRKSTLDVAISLQQRAREAVGDAPFIVVINKADVQESWEIKDADLGSLTALGWDVVRASAKNGEAVEYIFLEIAKQMLRKDHAEQHSTAGA